MSDDKGPFVVSRRVVIGAAGAAPVVAGADGGALADPAVVRCAEWLALDAEIDRLGLRCSDLETILVQQNRRERSTHPVSTAVSEIRAACEPNFRRGVGLPRIDPWWGLRSD